MLGDVYYMFLRLAVKLYNVKSQCNFGAVLSVEADGSLGEV